MGQMCERHDGHLPLPAAGLMQSTQANSPVLLPKLCSPPSFLSSQHAHGSPQVAGRLFFLLWTASITPSPSSNGVSQKREGKRHTSCLSSPSRAAAFPLLSECLSQKREPEAENSMNQKYILPRSWPCCPFYLLLSQFQFSLAAADGCPSLLNVCILSSLYLYLWKLYSATLNTKSEINSNRILLTSGRCPTGWPHDIHTATLALPYLSVPFLSVGIYSTLAT